MPIHDLALDSLLSRHSLRMQLLQRHHIHFPTLQRRNPLRGGAGCGERGDGGNPCRHRRSADGFLIEERVGALRGVDYQLNAFAFDQVDYVGAAFLYFVDALHAHADGFDGVGGAGGGDYFEPHVHEFAGDAWASLPRGL